MQPQFLLILICSVFCNLVKVSLGKDNCRQGFCSARNILCDNDGKFSRICHPHSHMENMETYQDTFANVFNEFRNKIANGTAYRSLPAATRMAKMYWSKELETFARYDVNRCNLQQKTCLSSHNYYYMGHIIDRIVYGGEINDKTNLEIIRPMLYKWTSGVASIRRVDTLSVPRQFLQKNTHKAALLLTDRNQYFGCAAMRFTYDDNHYFTLSCAFATGNLVGKPIYKWGVKPANLCYFKDSKYPNLCDIRESYGNDKRIKHLIPYREKLVK